MDKFPLGIFGVIITAAILIIWYQDSKLRKRPLGGSWTSPNTAI
jgi:hypothetical protein